MESKKSAEAKAIENYLVQKSILIDQGYNENEKTISIVKANVIALVILLIAAVILNIIYYSLWGEIIVSFSMRNSIFIIILFVISIPIHELLHGLGFAIFCKDKFRSVRFGIMKELLTPYCNCKEPLKAGQYLFGGMLPLIVLGIAPAIYGLMTQNMAVLIFAMFSISAAGGDLIIAVMIIRCKGGLFLDHPNECGFYHYYK